MGNQWSCIVPTRKEKKKIQLIHSDGSVEIVDKSINAVKIMENFPQHMVCRSDSFYIGKKIPALSHKEKLKMGYMYFLLPKQSFQSVLSWVSLASLISPFKANSAAVSSTPTVRNMGLLLVNPFEIEKVGGGLRIKICSEFISKLVEDGRFETVKEKENSADRLCDTPQLQKDYAQLVSSTKLVWRPKLGTIKEK